MLCSGTMSPRRPTTLRGLSTLVLLLGCSAGGGPREDGGGAAQDAGIDGAPDPSELPLLAPGNHLGIIVGFNAALPPATTVQVEARWDEAVAAGMRLGRVQVDWGDLEPRRGEYRQDELEEPLRDLSQDALQPFLLLDAFDSSKPADLQERLDSGDLTYGDPEVIDRFGALLDWAVPMLVSHGGWVISVTNEPGNLLDDLDPAARERRTGELLDFFAAARARVHRLEPGLAMTVTIREQETANELPFLAVVDVASFNFYCSRFAADLAVESDPDRIRGYLDGMLAAAGELPVVIQELGCHAGWEERPTVTGATAELQQRFYEVVLAELSSRPRLRAAVVFQLVDWDPALVEAFYSEPFRQAGLPESFIEEFAESLETVGLLRFEDGSARPAWDAFLDALPCRSDASRCP